MIDPAPAADLPLRLERALEAKDASARLQAALAAGTRPDAAYVPVLVRRCRAEPDFFVRDMLTWALTRHPADAAVPLLVDEVRSGGPQARSQALHTLSKIRDPRGWTAITPDLLRDPDDRVARSAWRAAVLLAPDDGRAGLAVALATQLGRGDRDVLASLSRALVDLGDAASGPLAAAAAGEDRAVRLHAVATQRLALDPEAGFDTALFEAEHVLVLAESGPHERGDGEGDRSPQG